MVGSGAALASLTTDAGGTTAINGGTVRTTGAQAYNDAVTLGVATTLTSTGGGAITLAGTTNGAVALAITTAGPVTLLGTAGGTAPLASLTIDGGDTTITDATATGAASITSSGNARIGALTAASIAVAATSGEVTGIGTGNANLSGTGGDVTVTSGTLARLGPVSASGAGSDIVVSGDVVSVDSATAVGLIDLRADVGNLTLGTGSAGATATLIKTGVSGELAVNGSVTGATGTTIGSSTNARIANAAATAGTLSVTATGALSGTGGGRANLSAGSGNVIANAGTSALLASVTSGTSTALTAGTALDATTVTAGTSATLTGASVTAGTVTATGGALAITATGGAIALGTGGAGTTATLTSTGGDITIAAKLTAAGNISLDSGDDVLLAAYNSAADTGLIRSNGGDVAIDAQGSVYGIGGGENTLPTTQRGVAALSTTGNLTINSDGDARFDSLTAGGSLALNIAGSLTGSPLSGGAPTGTNVVGGAIFATGAGGDVTIRSGLAATPLLDVVTLNRIVADRNITINADQLAIGTLATNTGTITLNDTSGAALTADNYYVGLLSGAGDLTVVLTGQPTAAIPLVALDAAGAPEAFDASFSKTDLGAGTAISGTIGGAAQLSDVAFGTTLNLGTAAAVADSLTSANGTATITATTGTLSILMTSLGGALSLTKSGGAAATAGDELRARSATSAGSATLTSSTHIRLGALGSGGTVTLATPADLTGLAGASTGTSNSAFGRANVTATGAIGAAAGGLAQLGTANAGTSLTVAAGTATSDGSIDLTTAQAGGALALTATGIAPLGDAAHDGDILIGSASAGTTMLVSNVSGGGDSGNIVSGALAGGGDTRIDAANDLTLTTVGSAGSLGARARRDASTGALTAVEDIGVSAGRNASLGAMDAGDDVLVTGAGAVTVAAAIARGVGPDTRTVDFASPTAIAFPAESNPGADIVIRSTTANVIASGALSAASDVTINASTSVALLGATTATAGNVAVTSGTSAQLVGDVTSGVNSTVTAGTTAAVQQNVTAGGNYTVTGGTGVTLGDASARTQAAKGAVTITATSGNVAQGSGRLTVIGNSDVTGTEALSITANAGSIVLANSQLTGGSIAGRESDVGLSASGAVTADDIDADRALVSAGGNIVADTIDAGNGAADLGDLAQGQSVDLVSTGGSVTVGAVNAIGTGHDIDIRAATGLTAATLSAGGSLVGRAGNAIAIGSASAGEDIALKSNTASVAITGATTAGDDVLLAGQGTITTGGAVNASGTGPDTRTVTFGAAALDAAYAAETNAGGDIVINSSGANVIASAALTAASDVTVAAGTSVALLGSTTATAGNVAVASGTSSQLVGDVTTGANTTISAGTTAAIQQNVTAGGNYTVTGGTGVTLGDGSARTQAATGNAAVTATSGDVAKGAGRLTLVANADRTAANNTETLTVSAASGNIVLANSQLTGGSTAGRESDVRLTANGITVGKVDGASLTARATTEFAAGEAISAGNAARGADPVSNASTVDIAVTAGPLSFTDITATNLGHDVVLNASGAINGANITAARSVIVNGGSLGVTGATTATAASVTINGGTTANLGSLAAGTSAAVTAGAITAGAVTTGTTLNLNATGSSLTLGSAVSGGDITLAAATRATLGPVTATGRNVTLSASDADINGAVAATQITVIDRATGASPLRLGDGAIGSSGFALSQAEINRLNAATVILDAGTGAGARQDVAIGTLALDADTGATRIDVLGLQRFDVTGTISASATGTRTLRLGGSASPTARATTMRFATTADAGGRVLVPGLALDLRADRIGMGLDASFLATLGLTPGGSPAAPATVATDYVARGSSTLYVADAFGAAVYTSPTILSASSVTVRYSDYALFQNTGGSAINSGAVLASTASPSSPALFLQGPNPPNAGGFALFGTINGVPDSAAAVLGDQIITLNAVDRISARINGCLIGSGSGCIASTTSSPPLPPLNAFRGDIFSTQGDFSIPFDPVVGTNNESLFGDVGSFGLSDLPLQTIECDPDKEGDCAAKSEDRAP
ncbi:S-layer family protein [Novosphingobium sp. Gsoil 351]|uniref:beta strand repeat-containing protein n=1 Tax=Novosphingobium sp. Gsoil 351 TaxID=2675225 RepID=UPI0012B4C882|nr:S-layer family protein [Novosphingobium sp. Gsoil 351]QGN55298.1 hypothetical protein GKE62_12845 [Novosphingobium sp. Gsoil 351]